MHVLILHTRFLNISCSSGDRNRRWARLGKTSPNMEKKQKIITRFYEKYHRIPYGIISDDTFFEPYSVYRIFWMEWCHRWDDDFSFPSLSYNLLGFSVVCSESSFYLQKIQTGTYSVVHRLRMVCRFSNRLLVCWRSIVSFSRF